MLEEMTGTNGGTVRTILVADLNKKKARAHIVPHLLMPDQKYQHAALSAEIAEMTEMF
jgi:hypothetical protein